MNYYALIYEAADDYPARRPAFREQHLRLAQAAYGRGELVLAGAFADPVNRALIVFRVDDKSKVEEFARRDPYVMNGLVRSWEVRPWTVVVGQEKVSSPAVPAPGTIMRRWSARTTEAQLPKYLGYFSMKVVPELRRVSGYISANVSTRNLDNEIEIVVETTWRSLESIRNFAGPDLEAAVVAPEAAALLTSFDRRAQHSEIVVTDGP
jgi:uncharacterized protein YciI/heme-degrading monooxygenase HmoA